MSNIQLPNITDKTSGLTMFRGKWHVFYYEGNAVKRKTLGTTDDGVAQFLRDVFHKRALDDGATYKTRSSKKKAEALDDPDSEAFIYPTYRVVIDGKQIGSSNDLKKAKAIRNKYLNNNIKSNIK